MNRRHFLAASCAAGLSAAAPASAATDNTRDYYELRKYIFDSEQQKDRVDAFLREAAIPAYNRIGISPVGVFYPMEGFSPTYVLLRHESPASLAATTQRLLADADFCRKGADVLDTPSSDPAYKRIESFLMAAFDGMRQLKRPSKKNTRVFQLRTYESHSMKAGRKKIEMFNTAEIAIFRKVGLNPVFFGESLTGSLVPNLTYMLGFDNDDQRKQNWRKFGGDPEWRKLRAIPEYADKNIVSHITNIMLKPAPYSQI
jgi:hypothetical protein